MTIDLDERFPHDDGCAVNLPLVAHPCDCTRDARIAAHIERLEGALRYVRDRGWESRHDHDCVPGETDDSGEHVAGCPVPGVEALMAELGGVA